MKKIALLIVVFFILIIPSAFAQEFSIRNGVTFGASLDDVVRIEKENGSGEFSQEENRLVISNAFVVGTSKEPRITYEFNDNGLTSIEYDIFANWDIGEMYNNADRQWADALSVLVDTGDYIEECTSGSPIEGPNFNGSSVIHEATPESIADDLAWNIYLLTGEDVSGSFIGYERDITKAPVFVYMQDELAVADQKVLFTMYSMSPQGDTDVLLRMVLHFALIN